MFCTKCGSQLPDNVTFCTNCGARVQNAQSVPNQENSAINMGQPNTNQSFSTPPYQGQPFNGQAFNGQPNLSGPSMGMTRPKSKTPLFVGIGAAGVVALIIFIFILKAIFGGGTNSSPENVVKAFFKAVSTQDVELLKKTVYTEGNNPLDQIDLLSAGMLKLLDSTLDDQFGNDWHKKIKVKELDSEKVDGKTIIEVQVKMGAEEEETIEVIKDGSKYYVSPDDLF